MKEMDQRIMLSKQIRQNGLRMIFIIFQNQHYGKMFLMAIYFANLAMV